MKRMSIEFTAANPLVVDIVKVDDEWDLRVSETEIIGGISHKNKMFERVNRDKNPPGTNRIPGEFKKRRASGSPKHPHFMEHHDHTPIVIDEAETVEFRCDREFVIYFERDPNVTPVEGPAGNSLSDPFGLGLPVKVTPNAGSAKLKKTVTTSTGGKGPKDQMYYKCTVWLIGDDGQTVEIDPDIICGNF
jgi:hypothetical protein